MQACKWGREPIIRVVHRN